MTELNTRYQEARWQAGEHWSVQGACLPLATMMPETFDAYFFPNDYKSSTVVEMARRICRSCTVQAECLQDALDTGDEGIRAATTPKQREGIRKRVIRL